MENIYIDTYLVRGGSVYKVMTTSKIQGVGTNLKVTNIYDPLEPICGKVDSKYEYITEVENGFGSPTKTKTSVELTFLGEKEMEFALGKYRAKVIGRKTRVEMAAGVSLPVHRMSTSYYVEKIGEIKRVENYIQKMPKWVGGENSELEKFFENIDYSDMEKSLKNMEKIDVDGGIHIVEKSVQSVWEVVEIREP